MARAEYDLCIIGGGAAGLVVAAGAATLGAKVCLIEKNRLGGDCLYTGCVPSKTLLHCARLAHLQRQADRFGLPAHNTPVELARVMERVQQVIKTLEPHDSPERFRALGVEVIFGAGTFAGHECFRVNGRALTARRFVLATGSRPAVPDIPGLKDVPLLTTDTVWDLREPVEHLVVLGAGPIGVELAQAFVRLGSRVSVVEPAAHILPREDEDLTQPLADQLAREGVALHLSATPIRAERTAADLRLSIRSAQGESRVLEASHLLVATGRRANTAGLGLEAAGVAVTHGRVVTDLRMRTTNPRIFACGDVTGPYPFTHMAEHQAGVVLRNALFHLPARTETRAVPWCTFTDPELARVGLSESEARAQKLAHRVFRFPFERIDRAHAEGETHGLAKLIVAPNGRLLGAAILGPQAGEIIHEYALALAHGMKVTHISRAIHIYPTLAQINRRVADEFLKSRLTPRTRVWLKRLLRLRGTG